MMYKVLGIEYITHLQGYKDNTGTILTDVSFDSVN